MFGCSHAFSEQIIEHLNRWGEVKARLKNEMPSQSIFTELFCIHTLQRLKHGRLW
jgi:hypothetical protein